MFLDDCIRCGEAPGIDDQGYCCSCHWAVKVEVEVGIRRFRDYLDAWALFAEWCADHETGWATRA
jgi:hypothetical protein